MDEMTRQNAALVEETNVTILSAADQVVELQQAVGFFKTTQGNRATRHGEGNAPLHDMARRMASSVKQLPEQR